jgi:hypothetical protein
VTADVESGALRIATLWRRPAEGEQPVLRDDLEPALEANEAERVARYLDEGLVVLAATTLLPDRLDPSREHAVPVSYITDGTWLWTGEQAYYLRTHGIPPQTEFLDHIRRSGYRPGPIPPTAEARALAWLRPAH